jgi:hypothetical protein
MRAEGHRKDLIVERLRAMGLDDADIGVLLYEERAAPADDQAERALITAGVSLVAGPLGGALLAAMSARAQPRPTLPAQVPLDPTDTSARCAWHPALASVAGCPRCGAFTCRECAPRPEEKVCANCRSSVAERDRRSTRVVRWISFWMFCVTIAAIVQAGGWIDGGAPLNRTLVKGAIAGGPFLVLGFVQLGVRNLWPVVIAALALVAAVVLTTVSVLWIAMAVVLLVAASLARSEVKAAREACTGL